MKLTHRKISTLCSVSIIALTSLSVFAGTATAQGQLLWGDTHLHSSNSTDAYLFGNMTADPETAYRFAKGLPVVHPGNRARVQIDTPLDFLVVADHAEGLGALRYAMERGVPPEDLGFFESLAAPVVVWWLRWKLERGEGVDIMRQALTAQENVRTAAATPRDTGVPASAAMAMARTTWNDAILLADHHNAPGQFTALIGWEWSSRPAGANLHRVVFTSADASVAKNFMPFGSDQSNYPEDLWTWLDDTAAATGADFVAIPHNSNVSKGYMFPAEERLRGTPIDAAWAKQRAKWETVVEATQIKGDSETHPSLSPEDPFADFEEFPFYLQPDSPAYDPKPADYVRSGLLNGLAIEERIGFNPYRFGLIGSTDSHGGVSSAEEPNFWGKFAMDSTPESKQGLNGALTNGPNGWTMSASGLAAVWAEENTREAILAAFKRREVYATTGSRIAVRVYGGAGISAGNELAADIAAVGRAGGVPMGGELRSLTSAPGFLIHAAKDPMSAHLDRVQMVKGWMEGGTPHERVYDVAWAGQATGKRKHDALGGVPGVPDTVDPTTARYTNEHGSTTLSAVWTDPDFDPSQRAFYYVRVLEVPTPRHSLRDAVALGIDPTETGRALSIQERAYTSPIHYRP
jgi:hypothetical protein